MDYEKAPLFLGGYQENIFQVFGTPTEIGANRKYFSKLSLIVPMGSERIGKDPDRACSLSWPCDHDSYCNLDVPTGSASFGGVETGTTREEVKNVLGEPWPENEAEWNALAGRVEIPLRRKLLPSILEMGDKPTRPEN